MKGIGIILVTAGVTAFILGIGANWWGPVGAVIAGVGVALMVLPRR